MQKISFFHRYKNLYLKALDSNSRIINLNHSFKTKDSFDRKGAKALNNTFMEHISNLFK